MYKIVFHILNTSSHFNSTIKIENSLKSKGYSITYFSFDNIKSEVLSNNFNFFSFPLNHFTYKNNLSSINYFQKIIFQFNNNRIFMMN